MRSLVLTVATAAVLALAFPQIPQVLAQGSDTQSGAGTSRDGTASQSRESDAVSSPESSKQSARSKRSAVKSGKSKTRIGSRSGPRRHVVVHKRGRVVASSGPRRRVAIHKRGRGVVALSEPRRRVMISRRHPGMATSGEAREGRMGSRMNMRSRESMGSSTTISRSARGLGHLPRGRVRGSSAGTTGQKSQSGGESPER
jgi:hypothetical protein